MEALRSENKISLNLTREEAIVLFEFVTSLNKREDLSLFQDQSEERVFWDIEASLESVMDEIFDKNYIDILLNSRIKLRDL
jgi:hypothetical protein